MSAHANTIHVGKITQCLATLNGYETKCFSLLCVCYYRECAHTAVPRVESGVSVVTEKLPYHHNITRKHKTTLAQTLIPAVAREYTQSLLQH